MASRQFYNLFVVRKAPIADPEEYTEAIDILVRALQKKDPARFYLSANSPAHQLYPIIDDGESNVWRFVSTSEIQWGHGREPRNPTHQIVFFNEHKDENYVMFKVKFCVKPPDEDPQECPGLVASLSFGLESSAPPSGTTRGQYLEELFSMLVKTFKPDHGHIELPHHPENESFPMHPDVGWLTYLSHTASPVPPALAEPASAVALEAGTTFIAVSPLTGETYADIAKSVDRVREALRKV